MFIQKNEENFEKKNSASETEEYFQNEMKAKIIEN